MLTLLVSAARILFRIVDEAVYGIIASVYKLMITIASHQVFNEKTFETFGKRVYALVGIFMLFKLAFSLIRYIVNPDEMKDSKKGGKKLIINVMVVVVLITITPTIFEQSRNLQGLILKENVIGNLILGISGEGNVTANKAAKDWELISKNDNDDDQTTDTTEDNEQTNTGTVNPGGTDGAAIRQYNLFDKTVGDEIATLTFSAFYFPAYGNCSADISEMKNDEENINASEENPDISYPDNITENCLNAFGGEKELAQTYLRGIVFNDIETLLYDNDLANAKLETETGQSKFVMKYSVLISTVAGIILLLIFINFCIEVAVRTIKLGFLELMAPIPIISYIDPKSAENGLFSKWLKMCVTTYLSLFIRLAAIYFAIFVIGEITSGGIDLTSSPLVTVFLILGALIFANQLPKMIEELVPSLKGSGTFSLNPMKTIGASPLASAAVGGVAGAVGGTLANSANLVNRAKKFNETMRNDYNGNFGQALTGGKGLTREGVWNATRKIGSNAMSPLGGGIAAGYGAARAGLGGKGSPMGHATQAITRSSQMRNFNEQKGGAIAGLASRATDKLTDVAGIKYSSGSTSAIKDQIKNKQHELQNYQQQEQDKRKYVHDKIAMQSSKASMGLNNHFDYSFDHDEKGNIAGYKTKTYEDYRLDTAKSYGISAGNFTADQWDAWAQTDPSRLEQEANHAASKGYIVTKDTYDAINQAYTIATDSDMAQIKLKKEITQLEEQRDIKKTITPNK